VNGLLTYDREVLKIDPARALDIHGDRTVPRPAIVPEGGLFLDSLSVSLDGRNAAATRYTLDGSEPTRNSALYRGPILLEDSGTVTARSFDASGKASATVSASFVKTDFKENPPRPAGLVSGLAFSAFEGAWEVLPDFAGLSPVVSGTAPNFTIDRRKRDTDFGFVFDGWIRVPADGLYSFFVSSDDGVRLAVNGAEVVLDDGVHGMREKPGQIALRAGWARVNLRYFQHLGGLGLDVRWAGPGFAKSAVSDAALFHER
jgi:alpha-L-fucosidase